jgi:hypothetical protein
MTPKPLNLAKIALFSLVGGALGGCHVQMVRPAPAATTVAVGRSIDAEVNTVTAPSFAGTWSDGSLVLEIVGDGPQMEVRYPNGRGPFVAKRQGPRQISVDFYDDAPCCTGRLASPDVIEWSNGGSWHRLTGSGARVGIDVRLEPTTGPMLPPVPVFVVR